MELEARREVGRDEREGDKSQKSEVGGQRAASQMVNLSNSQMVMNGVNDGLTISRFDQSPI